ncbi:MAG: 16S rRNA (cytidine(1402)-2'-O)-methyltransferase [Marinilabiliaceae bacterium]|nr:16S rRNA (cytidine(1402)-2'-O)-methyltransferase [Marinilabiliaceae bacterium]
MAKLTVVPTPVGNLDDITMRALNVLRESSFILAEDTRTTLNLLRHFDIQNQLVSYHKFNEHQVVESVVRRIESGQNAALVSDAGTPAISDPGYLVVRHCIDAGIEVECLPGATAFVPALVDSGLPNDQFTFVGFLPHKKGRQTALQELVGEKRTFILYESPFRLVKTLQQLGEYLGVDRRASVSREISKVYEETVRGTLEELASHFAEVPPKGEIVMVVEGNRTKTAKRGEQDDDEQEDEE